MASENLEIAEYNESGSLVASYVCSIGGKKDLASGDGGERVDIIVSVLTLFSFKNLTTSNTDSQGRDFEINMADPPRRVSASWISS